MDGTESSPKDSCKSLVEICSEEFVSDASSTERAVSMGEVPSELYCSLVKAALQNNRDEATQVRVKKVKQPWGLGVPNCFLVVRAWCM